MEHSSISTTPIVVDGEIVSEQSDTTSTAAVADNQLLDLMQQLSTQQQNNGQMLVIGCGIIIGIMLISLVRWWR